MGPRPQEGRRTPIATLFGRSAQNFETVAIGPQSSDTHIGRLSDWLVAKDGTGFYVGLEPCKTVI
jgi:hypothetical protein